MRSWKIRSSVRNIPKRKDGWDVMELWLFSRKMADLNDHSHRFGALRHTLKTFHEANTIFLSGQRIESHIGSVSWNIQHTWCLSSSFKQLMVFTVTSSDCKVKKARFYEFLFTLGWRLIGNTSLYKFPAPKHVSFRKYSSLNFRVFTVRDTKSGMLSPWKKSLRLIFSSLTISSIRRYVYAQVC